MGEVCKGGWKCLEEGWEAPQLCNRVPFKERGEGEVGYVGGEASPGVLEPWWLFLN